MSKVFHIGCLHIGHENMSIRRGFENSESYFETLEKSWNSVVSKRDKVFIHGDVTMEKSSNYHLLDKLHGSKIVIMGNHDLPKHSRKLLEHVDQIAGMINYKGFWLTHAPVHPMELLRVRGNIHAHLHDEVVSVSTINVGNFKLHSSNDEGYFCVDAKKLNYKPIEFSEIVKSIGTHILF